MKSLRNKVIMSAVVLVFAVIATIGSTYAWFTVSNQTTVSTMNVEVASSESLLMRAWTDGEEETEGQEYWDYNYGAGNAAWTLNDFTTNVDLSTTTEYGSYASWRMLPVTALVGETATETDYTNINVNNLRLLSTPEDDDARTLLTAGSNASDEEFLEFKFWLLRPGGSADDVSFNVTVSERNTTPASYTDAIHVAVIGDKEVMTPTDLTFDADADTITTAGAGGVTFANFNVGDTIIITDTVSNNGTFTVESATATVITVAEDAIVDEGTADAGATINGTNQELYGDDLDYAYAWQSFDAGYATGIYSALNSVSNDLSTPLANISADGVVNHLETANVPELVTVRIWIEGWDAETTNQIMGAQFNIALEFVLG